jgi:peptidoglycan/LPS O-acetylase OafA/YrhL
MPQSQQQESRILSLDALRGMAALIVFFSHLQLSFYPNLTIDSKSYSMIRIPLAIVVNGGAAVSLFFVLSGFVLTYRFFQSGTLTSMPDAVVRRWPRLAGPVVIVSLISGLLMGLELYRNQKLAEINGSAWLKDFFAWKSQGAMEVIHALKEGIYGTFVSQHCPYNMSFWTMHYELVGSFAAYAFTLFVIIIGRRVDWRPIVGVMLLLWGREVLRFPFVSCFFLGTILGLLKNKLRFFVWRDPFSLILTAILCVLIAGFSAPVNDFSTSIYKLLGADCANGRLVVRNGLHSLMALLLLSYALWVPSVREFLSRPLMRKLGHLSFPIYLLHLPIICSLGASTYLYFKSHGEFIASTTASLASIIATVLLSLPLAWIDDRWLVLCRFIAPFHFISKKLPFR